MHKDIKKVLLVCTGNSCPSIMTEGYLKKRLKEEGLDVEVESAGTSAFDGATPPEEALECLKVEGIGLEGLQAVSIQEDLIDWADIILVMENVHKNIFTSIIDILLNDYTY